MDVKKSVFTVVFDPEKTDTKTMFKTIKKQGKKYKPSLVEEEKDEKEQN